MRGRIAGRSPRADTAKLLRRLDLDDLAAVVCAAALAYPMGEHELAATLALDDAGSGQLPYVGPSLVAPRG